MISNADRTILISSLGWVDHDTLWRFDVPTARVERLPLGSGARYLSLRSSAADRFVVNHHFDGRRFELTVRLFMVSPSSGQVEVQSLEWYDDSYDKGYQGVVDVLEVPGERAALVAVQRSSQLILHDLATGRKIGIVELGARGGNPQLQYRSSAQEIWASDYDTIAVIAQKDWRVIRSVRLQKAALGM